MISINKPENWTSFDVVKKIRVITKEKKVGHGGTLDPFATGVLIIGTGKDTKKLSDVTNFEKEYIGVIKLGEETNTLDTEGDVIQSLPVPDSLNQEDVKKVFSDFIGDYLQVPPMHSAKKVKGKRLYELARKNVDVHRDPVSVTIFDLKLLEFNLPFITFSVTCSKGTYIRVLAKDIAVKLDTCGYLISLERTRIGEYLIENAQSLQEFEKQWSPTIA